jgi:radical SAM superfamily enzyme YgiQ (UPF0313 family)
MDIVFIKPPQSYLNDPQRNPPLGLMYIASVAIDRGHKVRYVDFSAESDDENLIDRIPEADMYAFTVSSLDYVFSNRLAKAIKKRSKCFVVFGGVLPTTSREFVNFDFVDGIVIGEGERAFEDLLEDAEGKGKISKRYIREQIKDIDVISFPYREGITVVSDSLMDDTKRSTTIITSRGCPFECAFCASKTMWGRKVRFRSVRNVLREIDYLVDRYEIEGLRFLDDTITLRRNRFVELCSGLKERNLQWRCSTRSNQIEERLAKMMYESGCTEVGIGVESADQNILNLLKKDVKVKDHEKAISLLKNNGIAVATFFMTGLPGEQQHTPDLNISFIEKMNPDRVFCTTFMPYPGTDIWNHPEKYGSQILTKELSMYNQVSGPGEEERPFVLIPAGMDYNKLYENRKRMIGFIQEKGKLRG